MVEELSQTLMVVVGGRAAGRLFYEAADREPAPTTAVTGGIHERRTEVQSPGVIAITVGSRGPVVAVAASIAERTISVEAREQKVRHRSIGTSIIIESTRTLVITIL